MDGIRAWNGQVRRYEIYIIALVSAGSRCGPEVSGRGKGRQKADFAYVHR